MASTAPAASGRTTPGAPPGAADSSAPSLRHGGWFRRIRRSRAARQHPSRPGMPTRPAPLRPHRRRGSSHRPAQTGCCRRAQSRPARRGDRRPPSRRRRSRHRCVPAPRHLAGCSRATARCAHPPARSPDTAPPRSPGSGRSEYRAPGCRPHGCGCLRPVADRPPRLCRRSRAPAPKSPRPGRHIPAAAPSARHPQCRRPRSAPA